MSDLTGQYIQGSLEGAHVLLFLKGFAIIYETGIVNCETSPTSDGIRVGKRSNTVNIYKNGLRSKFALQINFGSGKSSLFCIYCPFPVTGKGVSQSPRKQAVRKENAMYSEKVMDHFQNPRNVGEIEDASGVGTVGNAKCGDIMRIFLDIDKEGIIRDVKFKTFGCGAAVATSSMATELVKGKTIQEAMQVTNKAVMEALDGLPPVKVHCSLLAEEAIHAALWDYAEKNGITIEGLEKPRSDIGEYEEEAETAY